MTTETFSFVMGKFSASCGVLARNLNACKANAASPQLAGTLHRLAHVLEDASRTLIDLFKGMTKEQKAALDALMGDQLPVRDALVPTPFETIKTHRGDL